MQIIKGKKWTPRFVLLHAAHGWGKSTWASEWPTPIVVQTEEGSDDIGCDRLPVCKTSGEFGITFTWLLENCDDYETIVIDSADWLEKLFEKKIVDEINSPKVKCLDDIEYGKGPAKLVPSWSKVIELCNKFREKGKHVVLLAHTDKLKEQPPGSATFEKYYPDLHKQSRMLLAEACTEVLFGSREIFVRQEDLGFNKTRNIAMDGGAIRIVQTQDSPVAEAKNRLDMPEKMVWAKGEGFLEFSKHLPPKPVKPSKPTATVTPPAAELPKGNLEGSIVNGSSKV
jgi:hypothetical protein